MPGCPPSLCIYLFQSGTGLRAHLVTRCLTRSTIVDFVKFNVRQGRDNCVSDVQSPKRGWCGPMSSRRAHASFGARVSGQWQVHVGFHLDAISQPHPCLCLHASMHSSLCSHACFRYNTYTLCVPIQSETDRRTDCAVPRQRLWSSLISCFAFCFCTSDRVCMSFSSGAHHALCARCAKSRLFSTTGSHGSQGPEFCNPRCFELIMHPSAGGWSSGVLPG